MVLLLMAVGALASVSMTWVRASGSRIPDVADVAAAQADRPGVVEQVRASGTGVGGGAVLVGVSCLLAVLALWRVSPAYRAKWAGYATIVGAAVAGATVLWFVLDGRRAAAAVSRSMDVQTASVQVTPWPWVALAMFAAACAVGVALVPGRSAR